MRNTENKTLSSFGYVKKKKKKRNQYQILFFFEQFKNHQDTIETSCLKKQGQQQQNQCGWYLKKMTTKVVL